MKRFALVPMLLVAGCMQYSEIDTLPQAVTFLETEVEENALSFDEIDVRTIIEAQNSRSSNVELIGAKCHLDGETFEADFVTPARVFLPRFRGSAPDLALACTYGESEATHERDAANITAANSQVTLSGHPLALLVGVMAGAAMAAARDPMNDVYGYSTPNTRIEVVFPETTTTTDPAS